MVKTHPAVLTLLALAVFAPVACGGSSTQNADPANPDGGGSGNDGGTNGDDGSVSADGAPISDGSPTGDSSMTTGKVIFVIPMENKAQAQIYGDMTNAPYINGTLLAAYAHTTNFTDELPLLVSEPHYVFMEGATNQFSDRTFTTDNDPSASNSTNSTAHLVTQLDTAGISWMSYQESMTVGTCPINSSVPNFYAAKHDPFVFYQDVSGNPPSAANARCAAHHKPLTALTADLQNNTAATYNFITPNLCHDMHGAAACPQGTTDGPNIKAGDDWLKANLQPIIDYALAHNGFVFVTWDEGDATNLIPFIAIGKNSIAGHVGAVAYTHASLLKSEEKILGVPVLPSAAGANDFGDLFTSFP